MGGKRRAVHRCLATADVAVVRLGVACCLCRKPWLANAAEGRMVLAVQERRGRASRVRSADGAAMFDASRDRAVCRWMLSVRSTRSCSHPAAMLSRTPPRDRYQCRPNVKSRPCGRSLSLSLLQPFAPEPWVLGRSNSPRASQETWESYCCVFDRNVDSGCIPKLDKPLVDGGHSIVPT